MPGVQRRPEDIPQGRAERRSRTGRQAYWLEHEGDVLLVRGRQRPARRDARAADGQLVGESDEDGAPALAGGSDAGAVNLVFTHFALTLACCADAEGADRRHLVAGGSTCGSGAADRFREGSTARNRVATPSCLLRHGREALIGFTGAGIDRADHLRLQLERIAELAAHPHARLLRLADYDPVLDEAGRLTWDSLGQLAPMPS
jgi:hypothetical protein